jgi:hypothetical protein
MTFKESAQQWIVLVSRAKSMEILVSVMNQWRESVGLHTDLRACMDFETCMQCGDWDGARASIERTYGTWDRAHRSSGNPERCRPQQARAELNSSPSYPYCRTIEE